MKKAILEYSRAGKKVNLKQVMKRVAETVTLRKRGCLLKMLSDFSRVLWETVRMDSMTDRLLRASAKTLIIDWPSSLRVESSGAVVPISMVNCITSLFVSACIMYR